MEKNIVLVAKRPSFKARAKAAASKLTAVVVGSMVSASAFAQSEMPANVDDAASFMTTKGLIAIAVASAITLLVLGIAAAKLPRRGT
ncbi:hypothetical protein B9Y72_08685 [Stenotrophomonas maltophilia]|nr:hypothetical protein B9Y68_08685 [Stenotrophomonas maltophilia]PJL21880.1 hypothetical protein B9Y72_08685 [Stenotrophomonas maltophilia]